MSKPTNKALDELVDIHHLSPKEQHNLAAKVSALVELLVKKGIMTREEFDELYVAKKRVVRSKIRLRIETKMKRTKAA